MNSSKEFSMKQTLLVSAMGVMGLVSATAASAQEVGRVISSTPVVQQVPVSRQVCNQQPVAVQQPQSSGGGALIGAIAGGLLGHTVGGGAGRAVATGIGAVAGAAVGDSMENRNNAYAQPVAQCTTQTSYENRTVGYNVQYEYAGKTYNVQMPYDPGPTIKLQVQPAAAAPADGVQQAATTVTQPVYVAQTPSVVYPAYAYPAYGYSPYARPYWYPPVSFSLGYVYHGGGHRWHH
jgi:uncharacterized protein YcfJ